MSFCVELFYCNYLDLVEIENRAVERRERQKAIRLKPQKPNLKPHKQIAFNRARRGGVR